MHLNRLIITTENNSKQIKVPHAKEKNKKAQS